MIKTSLSALALGIAIGGAAFAETYEVKMLNKGAEGRMIFEPSFLKVAVGDSVLFVPTDKGHNAESVNGMIPEDAEAFLGKLNREIEATFEVEGVYGVMCKPHFAMGMVMTIVVGNADVVPSTFFDGRVPKKAKERFEAQLAHL